MENQEVELQDEYIPDEEVEAEEAELEAETEHDEHVEDAPQGEQLSRGQRRVQALANERRAAEQGRLEAEKRAADSAAEARLLREQMQMYQQPREDLSMLSEDELFRRQVQQQLQESRRFAQEAQMSAVDSADKSEYMTKAIGNPLYGKYSNRVEQEMQTAKSRGQFPKREAVLAYIVGQEALNGKFKANAQRKEAAKRVASATTSSPNMRSNVSQAARNTGRLSASEFEDKYGDVQF